MKICKVRIQNLNSLRLDAEIDFEAVPLCNTGLFAITGDTGSGKTTILDAITLALYGRIHRNKDVNEAMSYGAAESLAEVEFVTGKGRYLSRWALRRAHNRADGTFQTAQRQVMRWNAEAGKYEIIAEKIREADQVIETVTGLDYDRFTRSVLLAQGDFAAFLQAGEKERSDLLERITGTGIYTQLSQAAFARNKLEAQRLQALQQQRESLQVLSSSEVEALRQDQARLQGEIAHLRSGLESQRSALQWLERKDELEQRRDRASAALAAVTGEQEQARPDMERLTRHEGVQHFEARLQQLDRMRLMSAEEEEAAGRLEADLSRMAAEGERIRGQILDQEKSLNAVRAELEEKKALFDRIIGLDATLAEKSEVLDTVRQGTDDLIRELDERKRSQAANTLAQQALQVKLSELESWLASNQILSGLQEELSGMEQIARQLAEKRAVSEQLNRQLEQIRSEEERLARESAGMDEGLTAMAEACARLEAEFSGHAATYAIGRQEALHLIAAEIEQESHRREDLQQLAQLSEEYRQLLQQMSRYDDEQEELRSQEFMLNKTLMTLLDELEEMDRKIGYQQALYEQQLLIANYEKDRRKLKEGDPCPLCLSTHHPFRTLEIKPFVDDARQDLERFQRRREKVGRRYQELLRQHNEVALRQEQLDGNQHQALHGGQRELQERLEQYEARIALFAPSVEAHLFFSARPDSLLDRLEELRRHIETRRERHDQLQALHRRLEKQEAELRAARERHRDHLNGLALVRQKLEDLEDRMAGREGETIRELEMLRGFFTRYELEPGKDQDHAALFEQLRTRKAAFNERERECREARQVLTLAVQQAQQWEREATDLEKRAAAQQEKAGEAARAVEALRTERRALFGERNPQTERQALEQQINLLTGALESARRQLTETEKEHQHTQGKIISHTGRARRAREEAAALLDALEAAVQSAGFEDIGQVRHALLPPEEARALSAGRQSLQQREAGARKAVQDAVETLELHLKGGPEVSLSIDQLRKTIREQEERLGNIQQESGGIRERLNANESRALLAASLVDEIATQEREFRRWARLNEVIGMADGKKFRVFAQGLTLGRLVRLANDHLRQLNGRYIIRKHGEEDLGLDIIDTYQADHRRSMHTLSGGESFLVSLALALGLSDLAGQQTNIHSLFIDEGFGTLDENSLDLAISTLENLQASGKTIGIISHVKELKERIAVQIQVRKRANGFSKVQVVG